MRGSPFLGGGRIREGEEWLPPRRGGGAKRVKENPKGEETTKKVTVNSLKAVVLVWYLSQGTFVPFADNHQISTTNNARCLSRVDEPNQYVVGSVKSQYAFTGGLASASPAAELRLTSASPHFSTPAPLSSVRVGSAYRRYDGSW